MKIRSGFVSNSSSSSFIVIATEETLNKAKSTLTEFGREVVDEVMGTCEDVVLDGKSFKMATGSDSSEDFATEACQKNSIGEDELSSMEEMASEDWHSFKQEINKNGGIAKSIYS